jgi:hypothetical protein
MNHSTTSNWRSLLRAFYALLIAIAALLALPRNARAEIYVANLPKDSTGVVSAYTESGGLIKANFITGLDSPGALAVAGDTLFVLERALGTVGKYDANTGAVINAGFITGLRRPIGLAVSGETLFVSDAGEDPSKDGAVAEYDATTGELLNDNILKGDLDATSPTAVAVDPPGTTLFVASDGSIFRYNIRTGKGFSLYYGISTTFGLAVANNQFFETDTDGGGIYSVSLSGSGIPSLVMAGLNRPTYLAALGLTLFVVNSGSGKVATHGILGLGDNRDFITGLNDPSGIVARYPKTAQQKFTRNNSPLSFR